MSSESRLTSQNKFQTHFESKSSLPRSTESKESQPIVQGRTTIVQQLSSRQVSSEQENHRRNQQGRRILRPGCQGRPTVRPWTWRSRRLLRAARYELGCRY